MARPHGGHYRERKALRPPGGGMNPAAGEPQTRGPSGAAAGPSPRAVLAEPPDTGGEKHMAVPAPADIKRKRGRLIPRRPVQILNPQNHEK